MSPTTASRRRPSRSHSGSSTTGGAFVQNHLPSATSTLNGALPTTCRPSGPDTIGRTSQSGARAHRFGVAVHADASNLQPSVKFVAPPRLDYVPASTAEEAIDRFVLDVLTHVGAACDGLDAEYRQLRSERADPEVASWRTTSKPCSDSIPTTPPRV